MGAPLSPPEPVMGQELNLTPPAWADFGYAGAYDATKAYPILTIVTYNSVAYVSKIRPNSPGPTPVGAQPDISPDIWAPLPAR